jgi:fructokinase
MITVAGEALIDIVVDQSGSLTARPGGAPFSVARGVARLAGECRFLSRLSDDMFGDRLRATLRDDGVLLAIPDPIAVPTTLAIAQLDEQGSARYGFYTEGTSAAQLRPEDLPAGLPEAVEILALGGLGILLEPIASTLHGLISSVAPEALVLLDPNWRPRVRRDIDACRLRLGDFLARADVVKASVDDLRLLAPEQSPREGARSLLERGPRAVLLTDGAGPVTVHTNGAEIEVTVPPVDVVNTIGAGDAFVAAFLAWWAASACAKDDLADPEVLLAATTAAVEVAATTCTRAGANPPEAPHWWPSRGGDFELGTALRSTSQGG